MGEFDERQNPYTLLGLDKGFESTDAEIKKAFRKLALTKHPDKQPDNPNAAEEFGAIQRAYEILLDSAARGAWDQLAKAKKVREERHAGATAKRRKMTEELEKRERAFQAERSEEQSARSRLHAELDRLKRRHEEREKQMHAERMAAQTAASMAARNTAEGSAAPSSTGPRAAPAPAPAAAPDEGPPAMTEELLRTLKVSWDAKDRGYTAEELRTVFSAHGPVSDVVLRQRKKKKSRESAFVEMGTLEAAAAAARAANGLPDRPLLVVPFSKIASVEEAVARSAPASPLRSGPDQASNGSRLAAGSQQQHQQPHRPLFPGGTRVAPQPSQQSTFASFPSSFPTGQSQNASGRTGAANGTFGSFSASSFPGMPGSGKGPLFGSASRDRESEVLMKMQMSSMRQRAERAQLIAEMEAQGGLEDD